MAKADGHRREEPSVIVWLRDMWWRRQRSVDLALLWPECKAQATSLDQARAVFAFHAMNDPAWRDFYGDKLQQVISELT